MSVSITKRGQATVSGIVGSFDVVVYPIVQSAKQTQNFEEDIVKDNIGFDTAWNARNMHRLNDFSFKLVGDTNAHAKTGSTMLAAYATVTLSGFDAADFNGAYQNISGQEIDLGNTKVGDLMLKLRRYEDSTQSTSSVTTPS
jgi:hypothetical protein